MARRRRSRGLVAVIAAAGVHEFGTLCAQEPICTPGSIQPHGILLILAEPDLTITHLSANVEAMLGVDPATVCGRPLAAVFGAQQSARFAAALSPGEPVAANPVRLVLPVAGGESVEVDCVVHRSPHGLFVEIEPYDAGGNHSPVDLYGYVSKLISRMEGAADIAALVRVAADDIQAISGFDRALAYRFDEDWHGEVLAEVTRVPAPPKYLGLHFPAGDIPEQARRLYLKSPLRLIPDVDAVPAPLLAAPEAAAVSAVDLSRSMLRSVSPVHLQYLRNMDVRATLTVSIVIGGKLWGLLTCHHDEPRRVGYATRAACELLAHILASQVAARLELESLQEEVLANELIGSFGNSLSTHDDFAAGLIAGAGDLLQLFAAAGLVIRLDGSTWHVGTTPPSDAVVGVIAAGLHRVAADGVAMSHHLATLVPAAAASASLASGALFVALSPGGEDFVLCFREERIKTVNWGAEPDPPGATGNSLRPRDSFLQWQETLRGQSRRWSAFSATTARTLRQRLLDRARAIERRRTDERIRYLAHYDTLTQLPNRASFHETLVHAVETADRDGSKFAVLFVDVDRLKLFNDAFGHAFGDRILQATATRMRSCVRHTDVVARLGGDEFAIVLPMLVDENQADVVAGEIVTAIAEPFYVPDGPELRFTASVGIATYPHDGHDPDTLLQHADVAMYRAKEQGRNTFQRFGLGVTAPTYERLALEQRLQQGLAGGEFVPYYQPIVCGRTGKLLAMEALARWNHPDLGVLPPSRFIALAEESRLIVTLGEVMLRAACSDAVRWRALPGRDQLRVSVNVSARQFRDNTFLATVLETLAESGLAADGLQLELTESMLIGDEQYAMKTLQTLADAGISVAIDDFGTGYSSLSYLKRLPVDTLKIDQSFVRDLSSLSEDNVIVRAIIAMAHSLKLHVVAEGVETVEQLEFLRGEGCESIQGYLIGRPTALDDATAFIQSFDVERVEVANRSSARRYWRRPYALPAGSKSTA